MLSSLPGAAVTAFKIKGVQHEFSAIPGVKEDALEIALNLKALRMRVHSDQPVRLTLSVKGAKVVTAGDIEKNADVEIANPDLHIVTITEKGAEFEMEIFVSRGRGYSTTEERGKEKLELGVIAIDAVYSPVREVGYHVENVRVGQITDYDKLVMSIETDGTMTPKEAMERTVKILLDHFNLLAGFSSGEVAAEAPVMFGEPEPAMAMAMAAAEKSVPTEEGAEAGEDGEDEDKKKVKKKK